MTALKGRPKTPEHRAKIQSALLARRGETKRCKECDQDLPISAFPVRGGKQKGVIEARCTPCHRAYGAKRSRESYRRKPLAERTKHNRRDNLRRYHGITVEQFDELLAKQGGVCAVCHQKSDRWQVDHCHDTEVIRGILCSPCNTAIGLLGDDPDRMQRAAQYVARQFPPDALRSIPLMPSGAKYHQPRRRQPAVDGHHLTSKREAS